MKKLTLAMLMIVAFMVMPATHSYAQGTDLKTVMKNLQSAAADLVRETSFEDKAGETAAFKAFSDLFMANEAAIRAKSATAASNIDAAMTALGSALQAGDAEKAKTEATNLLKAVNDAAEPVTGVKSGTLGGIELLMQQLQASVRDLEAEITNKDTANIQRAYQALDKIYQSSKSQIQDKSPQAATTIETALNALGVAVQGGDLNKIAAAAIALDKAVSSAATMLANAGSTPTMPVTGRDSVALLLWLAGAGLVLMLAGNILRGRIAHQS
ncbi:MAG: hypothetical protein DLM69_07200 [Candidatus Chloroheliales bacterium]|nr:MAG: hypothetical protein DLM69_07200 [Chloroflexota bacterium]